MILIKSSNPIPLNPRILEPQKSIFLTFRYCDWISLEAAKNR